VFELATNERQRLWVALIGGTEGPIVEDYEGVVRVLTLMASVSPKAGEPSVFILDVLPGSARPPPVWRKKFADAEKLGHGKRVAFAVVTDSALLRGIRVAVSWIAPPPAGYEATALATLEEAVEWVEKSRPGTSAALRELHREATMRARVSGKLLVANQ
jgi:hypothetical protein